MTSSDRTLEALSIFSAVRIVFEYVGWQNVAIGWLSCPASPEVNNLASHQCDPGSIPNGTREVVCSRQLVFLPQQ